MCNTHTSIFVEKQAFECMATMVGPGAVISIPQALVKVHTHLIREAYRGCPIELPSSLNVAASHTEIAGSIGDNGVTG
jgi:hypothetical protein